MLTARRIMNRITGMIFITLMFFSVLKTDVSFAVARTIKLPEPSHGGTVSVEEAIYKRKSVRNFKAEGLTLPQVSQLLWAAGGMTVDGITGPTRAYASAGGIYPLDIYLVAGEVSGLAPGVYRYEWKTNELVPLKQGDPRDALARGAMGQGMIKTAPATIVIFADPAKTARRYGSRGEQKYVSMDTGHLGQNVHLQAQALGLGTVMVGAFSEPQVKSALGIKDGEPVYMMPVGYEKN